jgi:hypothetical protein
MGEQRIFVDSEPAIFQSTVAVNLKLRSDLGSSLQYVVLGLPWVQAPEDVGDPMCVICRIMHWKYRSTHLCSHFRPAALAPLF